MFRDRGGALGLWSLLDPPCQFSTCGNFGADPEYGQGRHHIEGSNSKILERGSGSLQGCGRNQVRTRSDPEFKSECLGSSASRKGKKHSSAGIFTIAPKLAEILTMP